MEIQGRRAKLGKTACGRDMVYLASMDHNFYAFNKQISQQSISKMLMMAAKPT